MWSYYDEINYIFISLIAKSCIHEYVQHDINESLTTKLYDKREDFNFPIVNYPFLDSNIL